MDEVGQIRSSRGISMNRMTNDEALWRGLSEQVPLGAGVVRDRKGDLHGEGAENDDQKVDGEDVGNAQC